MMMPSALAMSSTRARPRPDLRTVGGCVFVEQGGVVESWRGGEEAGCRCAQAAGMTCVVVLTHGGWVAGAGDAPGTSQRMCPMIRASACHRPQPTLHIPLSNPATYTSQRHGSRLGLAGQGLSTTRA